MFDYHSILQHVSAVYLSHHQVGYKKSKKRPLPTNSGYKSIVEFIIIILKTDQLLQE